MDELRKYLKSRADGDLLPWAAQLAAAEKFELSLSETEEAILETGLLPARYQRNRRMLTTAQQLRLFRSRVAVLGCGGLGGYIIEELARLGVGTLVAVDPDVFEEHNLNRQLFATPDNLGSAKVAAAAARVAAVNPAVTLVPLREAFGAGNGASILKECHAAVDALDSIPARLELADACEAEGIPLIHGAIGGWYGQIAVQFPGDESLRRILSGAAGRGIERELGNPSFTPAVVASLQVAETAKILLGVGRPLRRRLLVIDLLEMELMDIPQ
jgi:molybdopterin/thiamine biosynthesis adenylyltransferase